MNEAFKVFRLFVLAIITECHRSFIVACTYIGKVRVVAHDTPLSVIRHRWPMHIELQVTARARLGVSTMLFIPACIAVAVFIYARARTEINYLAACYFTLS